MPPYREQVFVPGLLVTEMEVEAKGGMVAVGIAGRGGRITLGGGAEGVDGIGGKVAFGRAGVAESQALAELWQPALWRHQEVVAWLQAVADYRELAVAANLLLFVVLGLLALVAV